MPQKFNFKNKIHPHDLYELKTFFQTQSAQGIHEWKKDKIYALPNGNLFTFTHDISERGRKKRTGESRYEVISNKAPKGAGSYGTVTRVQRTLAFYEHKAPYQVKLLEQSHDNAYSALFVDEVRLRAKKVGKDGERRVVKKQMHGGKNSLSIDALHEEIRLTEKAGYLHIKKPTLIKDNQTNQWVSYTIMDEVSGKNLEQIFIEEDAGLISLSVEQRLLLSHALLRALKEQVSAKGLVHRDIKPDNIMVSFGPPLVVKILDFGISIEANQPDGIVAGNPRFIAPEASRKDWNGATKADVYSMAGVIAMLWHVPLNTYLDAKIDYPYLDAKGQLQGIFGTIVGIEPSVKSAIHHTLIGMLTQDPKQRFSIDEAIKRFPSENKPYRFVFETRDAPPVPSSSYINEALFAKDKLNMKQTTALLIDTLQKYMYNSRTLQQELDEQKNYQGYENKISP